VSKLALQPTAGSDRSLRPFSALPSPTPQELIHQLLDPTLGVLVINREEHIHSVNRAFEDALGLPAGLSLGKDLGGALLCSKTTRGPRECGLTPECLSCEAREIALAALTRGETRGSLARFRLMADGESQEVELRVCAAPLELNGKKLVVLVVEDLSPLRKLGRVDTTSSFHGMVGKEAQMLRLFEVIRRVGPINVPVLIQGESGTGKELVVRALHQESSRRDRPLVAVNTVALVGGLFESELFGHVKGAFTGASRDRLGRFELAQGGTIFLDEIGELSPELQAKLLRVLQNRTFERIGGEETINADARVICATSRDLGREVAGGGFRQDLFYRLSVVLISLPPLRQRSEDMPLLAEHLLGLAAYEFGLPPPKLMPSTLAAMAAYSWPGNVRELGNVMRSALIESQGKGIAPEHLPAAVRRGVALPQNFVNRNRLNLKLEKIDKALQHAKGNKSEAARRLGVSRATLYRHLDQQKRLSGPGDFA